MGRYQWLDEDYVERPGRDRLGMMNMMVIFASPTCTSVGLLVDKDDLIKYQLFISYGLLVGFLLSYQPTVDKTMCYQPTVDMLEESFRGCYY